MKKPVWILGLLLLSAFIAIQVLIFKNYSSIETSHFTLVNGAKTLINKFSPKDEPSRGVVILLHGRRCSAAMMAPMARDLARSGLTVYSFDIQGHGQSNERLKINCRKGSLLPFICDPSLAYRELATPAILGLINAEHLERKKIMLVGHSLGGTIAQFSVGHESLTGFDIGFINLDGNYNEEVMRSKERALMLLAKENELKASSENMVRTESSHLEMIRNEQVFDLIINRMNEIWSTQIKNNAVSSSYLPEISAVLFFFIILLSIGLCKSVAPVEILNFSKIKLKTGLFYIIGVLFLSYIIKKTNATTQFLQIPIYGRFLIFNFYSFCGVMLFLLMGRIGVKTCILDVCRSLNAKRLAQVTKLFAAYVLLGLYADNYFYHMKFSFIKLSGFLFYLITFFLLSLCTRILFHSESSILQYFKRLLVWATLAGSYMFFNFRMSGNNEIFEFFIVIATIEFIGTLFESQTKSKISASLLTALLLAWLVSVLYPSFSYNEFTWL